MTDNVLNSPFVQFTIGGITVAGIAYLSNHVSPLLAAIFGALPLGILSSYFIKDKSDLTKYLITLLVMTIILVFLISLDDYFETKLKFSKPKSLGIIFGMWVVLSAIVYFIEKRYNL